MNNIIDINTNKQYSIFSKKGTQLLKNYIKYFKQQSGGTSTISSSVPYYSQSISTTASNS